MSDTALPSLPKFEGRAPQGQTLKVSGAHDLDAALWGAHRLEDVVYAIVACRVGKVSHDIDKDGEVIRVETLGVARIALMDDTTGEALLHEQLAAAGVTLV